MPGRTSVVTRKSAIGTSFGWSSSSVVSGRSAAVTTLIGPDLAALGTTAWTLDSPPALSSQALAAQACAVTSSVSPGSPKKTTDPGVPPNQVPLAVMMEPGPAPVPGSGEIAVMFGRRCPRQASHSGPPQSMPVSPPSCLLLQQCAGTTLKAKEPVPACRAGSSAEALREYSWPTTNLSVANEKFLLHLRPASQVLVSCAVFSAPLASLPVG